MLRLSLVRFPRAEYRPLTFYEEVFGYAGAKRNANIFAFLSFLLWGTCAGLVIKQHYDNHQASIGQEQYYQTQKDPFLSRHPDLLAERAEIAKALMAGERRRRSEAST